MHLHWCGSDSLLRPAPPTFRDADWGGGVLTACTRQTSVELEHLPSWPSHIQPACTIHSPPKEEYSSSYASNNPKTWGKMAKYSTIADTPITLTHKLPPKKQTVTLALYGCPSKNWHIITAYLFLYRHSTQILQAEPFKCFFFSDIKAVRDETKMGAEFSRRALLSLLLS